VTLLLDFQSCAEVDTALIDETFGPVDSDELTQRDHVMRLLARMERVARPGRGAHRIFAVIGRLTQCRWVSRPLDVLVRDTGATTQIDIHVTRGPRLVLLRSLSLEVPFAELESWVAEHPYDLAPLGVSGPPSDTEIRLRSDTQSLRPPRPPG
jgi:hypothetical protein